MSKIVNIAYCLFIVDVCLYFPVSFFAITSRNEYSLLLNCSVNFMSMC